MALRLTDACTIRPRSDVMRSFRLATRAGSLLPALRASALLLGLPAAAVAQNSAQPAQAKKTTATPLEASIDKLATHPTVVAALGKIQSDNAWTLEQQVSLCQIPAPPFKEAARAAAYRDRMKALGIQNVRLDSEGNVIGEIKGTRPGPTLLLAGHLDTVFPEGTDVTVKREGTKFTGPGIGDDCRGLAVVLSVARQIITQKVPFGGRLLVVGNVGEEGPGNLRGTRALFSGPLKDSIDLFISVDGTGFGITNGGVGSNRYRVHYKGPGGHSYGAFGMPNPIHAMGRAIAKIADLEATTKPKVTFNVGIISGGTSVNSIPFEGIMEIDLRSESATALAEIDARLQKALRQAITEEKARWPQSKAALDLVIDTIGIRPAGSTPDTSLIVRTSLAAARTMNVYTPLTTSSTDANVPMNLGRPAVTLDGGGVGRGAHSLDESYDDRTDGYKGPQWVMLVVLGLLGVK
ncbi:MAG TPA: peptidase M20 [Gemmatimonas aurantiaca]|uniref:Peptidase M20 n=2 Tax=Gemmatimonas aurantiaca TaxID=173480 RepID=A0A3D4V9K4_9BACT|nr:peptidase M20 [Gemmatimonas aurantiaca]